MQNCKSAKSVFKILAFTFLYEIGYFSAKTTGDATIFYKLKFYLYKDALCAKAKNCVQPIQRRRCLKFQLAKNLNFDIYTNSKSCQNSSN